MDERKRTRLVAARRMGTFFAAGWALLLVAAFVVYPRPDNLITGYPIFALYGLDALGNLTMADALGLGILQIAMVFSIGYVLRRCIGGGN